MRCFPRPGSQTLLLHPSSTAIVAFEEIPRGGQFNSPYRRSQRLNNFNISSIIPSPHHNTVIRQWIHAPYHEHCRLRYLLASGWSSLPWISHRSTTKDTNWPC
jgi:hypothetical protein